MILEYGLYSTAKINTIACVKDFEEDEGCIAEWKGVQLPGGRLELMVKPGGATPTTLVSPVIDHIIATAFK